MPSSSTVSAGDTVLAAQYNNVRLDALASHATYARVSLNSIAINDNTITTLTGFNEDFDTGTYFSSSNSERFTISTAGLYLIRCAVQEVSSTPTSSLAFIIMQAYRNGSTLGVDYKCEFQANDDNMLPYVQFLYYASASDYFHFTLAQDRADNSSHTYENIVMEIASL